MRRGLIAILVAASALVPTAARAGNVCINGTCKPVPGVHANINENVYSTYVSGGVDSGPSVGQSGIIFNVGGPNFVRIDANGGQIFRADLLSATPYAVLARVCVQSGCTYPMGYKWYSTLGEVRLQLGNGQCVQIKYGSPGLGSSC